MDAKRVSKMLMVCEFPRGDVVNTMTGKETVPPKAAPPLQLSPRSAAPPGSSVAAGRAQRQAERGPPPDGPNGSWPASRIIIPGTGDYE